MHIHLHCEEGYKSKILAAGTELGLSSNILSRSSISRFSAQLKGRTHTWKGFTAQLRTAALSNPALQTCHMGLYPLPFLGKGSFGEKGEVFWALIQ